MPTEKKFTASDLMRSFELIYRHGELDSIDGYRRYGPVKASTGFDGYTITLENATAAVTVNFHNTLTFSTTKRQELEHLYRDISGVTRDLLLSEKND